MSLDRRVSKLESVANPGTSFALLMIDPKKGVTYEPVWAKWLEENPDAEDSTFKFVMTFSDV